MFLANMLCWYHSSEKKKRIVIPRIIYKLIQFIERKRRCLGVNEKYIKTAISDTSASECKEMQKSNKGGDKQYFFKLRTICYKKNKKNWELCMGYIWTPRTRLCDLFSADAEVFFPWVPFSVVRSSGTLHGKSLLYQIFLRQEETHVRPSPLELPFPLK